MAAPGGLLSPAGREAVPGRIFGLRQRAWQLFRRRSTAWRASRRVALWKTLRRFLLWPSGVQLTFGVLLLFTQHLRREPGSLTRWLDLVRIAIQADLVHCLCALLSALCLLAAACQALPVPAWRTLGWEWRLALFCGVFLLATLCWSSLVKVTELHGLELLPTSALWTGATELSSAKAPDFLHMCSSDSLYGFITCWSWVPLGVLRVTAQALMRPWLVVLGPLPCFSKDLVPQCWWEWRELLVALTFWGLLLACLFKCLQRRLQGRRRPRALPRILRNMFATFTVFLVTSEPLIWLWTFLVRSLLKLCCVVRGHTRCEEVLALVGVFWLLLRSLYVTAHGRHERKRTQQQLEERLVLMLAQQHMRAELEAGFGETLGNAGVSSSVLPEHIPSTPAPCLSRLCELRERLLEQRRHELREEVPGALLPSKLHFSVRRSHLLLDSLWLLYCLPVAELLAPGISVGFDGEVGIDAGGVSRDWFDSVGRALAGSSSGPSGDPGPLMADTESLHLCPRPLHAFAAGDEMKVFRRLVSVGRFLAAAVLRGRPLPLQLSAVCCKLLLQEPLTVTDVWQTDPDFYRHRVRPLLIPGGLQALEAALGEPLTFVAAPTEGNGGESYGLLPGGASRRVLESDRSEYLRLLCEERLCGAMRQEVQCLQQGFWDVLPLHILRSQDTTPEELSALISGSCNPDPEEWRSHSSSHSKPLTPRAAQVLDWFWEAVQTDLTAEQRCLLLRFSTGSSRPPPGGFADLRPPFAVEVSALGSEQHLPTAHTCANKLVLHRYSSKAQLVEKLLAALLDEGFGSV